MSLIIRSQSTKKSLTCNVQKTIQFITQIENICMCIHIYIPICDLKLYKLVGIIGSL